MSIIIGIDEVGRGCLAGPVLVAAVAIPKGAELEGELAKLTRDSKQLTPKQREEWSRVLVSHSQIEFSVARVNARGIEKRNIAGAANLAAFKAWRSLHKKIGLKEGEVPVYLDGGLYLKNSRFSKDIASTIINGDETIPAIMAASIIAKVLRDRFMCKMDKKYPGYGFRVHKGYATKMHREALEKLGTSDIHRLTFLKKCIKMQINH